MSSLFLPHNSLPCIKTKIIQSVISGGTDYWFDAWQATFTVGCVGTYKE